MWRISFLTPKEFSSRRKNNLCLHLDTISVQWFDHFSLQSNVIPRYLKLSQISTIELSIGRGTWEILLCLKSNINSLVFAAFNNKLWTLHHWTTSDICSLYSLSSLLEIKPTITVSSAYLIRWQFLKRDRNSFVYIINSIGESTQPWGAPVLIDSTEDKISFIRTLCSRFVKKSRIS